MSETNSIILVNTSKTPISIFLPSGKPLTVPPGIGVRGDWCAKYIGQVAELQLIQQVPANFNIRGITDPMKDEFVRDNRDPSHFRRPEGRSTPVTATSPLDTKASAAASKGESQDTKDMVKREVPAAPAEQANFQGATADVWRSRIRQYSDSTLGQQLKLPELREVARLLDIDAADVLSTKKDLITALRVKVGG